MPKYLCLQRSVPSGDDEQSTSSATQMDDMYAKFNAWMGRFKANLSDMGGRLGEGRLVTSHAVDGPLVEVKELVGGYMIVTAGNLQEAIKIARECPGLVAPGSGVEVIEILSP